MMFMYDNSIPEHLDARTTISTDIFYCILASKLPPQNNHFFTWPIKARKRNIATLDKVLNQVN